MARKLPICLLSPRVWKVQIHDQGFLVGTVYRGRHGVTSRGTIPFKGGTARIFFCDGRVETVPQT
jgi:hypothetical protein